MAMMKMGAAQGSEKKDAPAVMRMGAAQGAKKEKPKAPEGKEACPECGEYYSRLSSHMVVHEE